eukprot:6207148-Pleurochrysis_carterae.AAC.2
MREQCRSMEFGLSGMPGRSEVQKRAGKLQQQFVLRSMRDAEGRQLYDRLLCIIPWLLKAWEAVLDTASAAEGLALREQLGSERDVVGNGFHQGHSGLEQPEPHACMQMKIT